MHVLLTELSNFSFYLNSLLTFKYCFMEQINLLLNVYFEDLGLCFWVTSLAIPFFFPIN